jgi:hypothetical protein
MGRDGQKPNSRIRIVDRPLKHIWVGVKKDTYRISEFPYYVGSWSRDYPINDLPPAVALLVDYVKAHGTPKNPLRKDEWENYWLALDVPQALIEDVKNG